MVLTPPFGAEVATMYYAGVRDVGTDGLSVERKRDGRTGQDGGAPNHGSEGWVPMVPQLRELLRRHRAWASAEAIRRANVDLRTGSDMLRHADPALMLRTYQHPERAQMSRAARKIGRALAQPTAEHK